MGVGFVGEWTTSSPRVASISRDLQTQQAETKSMRQLGMVVKNKDSGLPIYCLASSPITATYYLCDLGEAT